jgi:lipopolysaccharide transport system ATP-binding protein
MSSEEAVVLVDRISKCYRLYENPAARLKEFVVPRLARLVGATAPRYAKEFWALTDVSFDVRRGETVGIIGRNGAGKSTLLQILCGTLTPTSGSVRVNGRVAALLELGAGFNPEFTGRENVYLSGQLQGLSRPEIDARFDEIAAFADIGEFVDQPAKTYSSGMYVRLAFAVSASLSPEILVVDEALAVGDFAFNLKCFKRLEQLRADGCSIVFVSHDVGLVQKMCDRVLYLTRGRTVCFSSSLEATSRYVSDIAPRDSGLVNDSSAIGASQADAAEANDGWPTAESVAEFRAGLPGTVAGTGDVIVESCRVNGGTGAALHFGDRIVVDVRLRAHQPVDDLNVSVYVIDDAGQLLLGSSTALERVPLGRLEAGQRLAVRFAFENRLREGHFGLTVIASRFLSATNFEYLDYLEPAVQFRTIARIGQDRWAIYAPHFDIDVQHQAVAQRTVQDKVGA